MRRFSHEVKIGNCTIGGNNPVLVQSMCSTKTTDIKATVEQILALEQEGCEIVRVAIPDFEAAAAISMIRREIHIPLVADIHFDHRLALAAIENGVDKIRINPGNMTGQEALAAVVHAAMERNVPIRVGVNSGSLEKVFLEKYGGHATAQGLVESALQKARMIEDLGYGNLVLSIKASDVPMAIVAHRLIAQQTDHPIHVGITEAGTLLSGCIKSAVGIGVILNEGIGDTIRVSLTGSVLDEVRAGYLILSSLGLRRRGIEVVSCPTCGRTSIDLISLAETVNEIVRRPEYSRLNIKVACMGCVVNGPGEARDADLGICGGKGEGLIIRKGNTVCKVPEDRLAEAFRQELDTFL